MSARALGVLRARFGTEVPAVLWSPPDPRRPEPAPAGGGRPADDAPAGDELADDELAALAVLAAPDVRIEGRATGPLEAKLCLARAGAVTARVVRAAGTATVDLPYCDGAPDRLAALVGPLVGRARAADPAVAASFAAEAGLAALGAGDCAEIAAALRGSGVPPDAARRIGRAFARSTRSCEFTVYAGRERCPAVVAVIDSPEGRIVALTVGEPGGGRWTAVADGTAHRVGRALRRACEELPGGGWTP